jgi:hypothetical protein
MLRQLLFPIVPFIKAWRIGASFWLGEILEKDEEVQVILVEGRQMVDTKDERDCYEDDQGQESGPKATG